MLTEENKFKNNYMKYYQDLANRIKQIKESEKRKSCHGCHNFPLVELEITGIIRRNWKISTKLKWCKVDF